MIPTPSKKIGSPYQRSQQGHLPVCHCELNRVYNLLRDEPHRIKPPDMPRWKQPRIVSQVLLVGHEIRVSIVSMVEIVFFWGEVLEGAVCQQPAPCWGCAADVAEEWKLWPLPVCHCCFAQFRGGG